MESGAQPCGLRPFCKKIPSLEKYRKTGKNFFSRYHSRWRNTPQSSSYRITAAKPSAFTYAEKKRVPAEAREGVRRKAACCVAPNRSSLLFEKKREFALLISVIAFWLYKICIYIINFLLRLSSANGKKFIFLRQNQALRFLRRSKGVQENKIPLFHHGKCEL